MNPLKMTKRQAQGLFFLSLLHMRSASRPRYLALHAVCVETALPLEWPVFRSIHQGGAHRIHADVIRFFHGALDRAQAVIEEIILPTDFVFGCQPSFPVGHRFFEKELLRKGYDPVEVIRHGKDDVPLPVSLFLSEADGFLDRLPDLRLGELVHSAWQAIDRNKESCTRGIDPHRNIVGQMLSPEIWHECHG